MDSLCNKEEKIRDREKELHNNHFKYQVNDEILFLLILQKIESIEI